MSYIYNKVELEGLGFWIEPLPPPTQNFYPVPVFPFSAFIVLQQNLASEFLSPPIHLSNMQGTFGTPLYVSSKWCTKKDLCVRPLWCDR